MDEPLSLQSGDSIAVRIRKSNPADVRDMDWRGEVVDHTRFAGLSDICAVITCPYDKDLDCWSDPNPTPLGLISKLADCSSAKEAMDALVNATISLVDIHPVIDEIQFRRQMNSLNALQEQIAWEKTNDTNGRSCTADLLLCNRFDCLPIVDLYEGVDEDAVAAISGSLNERQSVWTFVRGFGTVWGVTTPAALFNNECRFHAPSLSNQTLAAYLTKGKAYEYATKTFLISIEDPKSRSEVVDLFSTSMRTVWYVGIAFAGLAWLLIWVEEEIPLRSRLKTEYGLEDKEKKRKELGNGDGGWL